MSRETLVQPGEFLDLTAKLASSASTNMIDSLRFECFGATRGFSTDLKQRVRAEEVHLRRFGVRGNAKVASHV